MFWSFRDHQSYEYLCRRPGKRPGECQERPAQKFLGGQFGLFDVADQRINPRRQETADDGLEQVFFGFEVKIKKSFADAGPFCNFIDPGRRVAFLGERRQRGLGNFSRTIFLATLKAACSPRNLLLLTRESVNIP